MTKSIKVLAILLLLNSGRAFSQSSSDVPSKWSLETELIQPFLPTVNIVRIQALRSMTSPNSKRKGELILGMYIRPNIEHDVVEKINEYMVIAGYRQYLWKGLHIEAKANIGYAWGTKNLIDGKDYETVTLFYESNLGYKFNLTKKSKNNFYLIPQFGILGNARGENTVNIGPRGGKPDTFIQGNLMVGISF
jgi:hypothetical protein